MDSDLWHSILSMMVPEGNWARDDATSPVCGIDYVEILYLANCHFPDLGRFWGVYRAHGKSTLCPGRATVLMRMFHLYVYAN